MSLRYKDDGNFWFSFFHEAGHILKHGKRKIFIDELEGFESESEKESDKFAIEFLIPEKEFSNFIQRKPFSKQKIINFANELDLAPGIIVGRLQHDRLMPYSYCNDLKLQLKDYFEKFEYFNVK